MIRLLKIRENENIAEQAANWFHQKWGIPLKAYQESICECLKKENAVPQWYVAMDNHGIVGGLGVIEKCLHISMLIGKYCSLNRMCLKMNIQMCRNICMRQTKLLPGK